MEQAFLTQPIQMPMEQHQVFHVQNPQPVQEESSAKAWGAITLTFSAVFQSILLVSMVIGLFYTDNGDKFIAYTSAILAGRLTVTLLLLKHDDSKGSLQVNQAVKVVAYIYFGLEQVLALLIVKEGMGLLFSGVVGALFYVDYFSFTSGVLLTLVWGNNQQQARPQQVMYYAYAPQKV